MDLFRRHRLDLLMREEDATFAVNPAKPEART
jgi:hypothetical protein